MSTQNLIIKRLSRIERLLKLETNKPLTAQQAADYLSVSINYLYKLTSQKVIPYCKPNGKLIFFRKADLNRFMRSNRVITKDKIQKAALEIYLKSKK